MRKRVSKYRKLRTVTVLRTAIVCAAVFIFLMPVIEWWHEEGENRFTVFLDGVEMGVVGDLKQMGSLYREARRELAQERGSMSFVPMPELTYEGEELLVGEINESSDIKERMKEQIAAHATPEYSKAYSIKVGETMVNVNSADEVRDIFQETISVYDESGDFQVELVNDRSRELNVLVPVVEGKKEEEEETSLLGFGGAAALTDENDWDFSRATTGFDSYDYGIEEMHFSETIEIVEAYLPSEDIIDFEAARSRLTELQELQQIYEVQSGDTLSGISLKVGLPLDRIIALNDSLESENSIIRAGQELVITVPEPELSVIWTETTRKDEVFDLPIEYIYNDDWYTSKAETLRQPSAGYHETVSLITRKNTEVESSEILYEEVGVEAVAKLVEKGTKVPPTYIKPLAGGRISSGFGRRGSPGGIGSTNHQGLDIATPTGTTIWAASAGTVTHAGWAGGYGYLVTIRHPDGWETRYAHLSRVLVSVGQYVNQGQTLALSGSTGNSTGPHLHFEIRINGVAQDPRNYVSF